MANKIYVPGYTPQKYPCVVYSNGYIQAYTSMPRENSNIVYERFYQSDHYNSITGVQNFGNNTPNIACLPTNQLTSDFYYRSDLDQILISFLIIVVIGFGLPIKIFSRLFQKGRL